VIISTTPLRVSLFGGSTDYFNYYSQYKSLLIGFAIKKYIYTTLRYTPQIFDFHSSIHYSQSEYVDSNDDIKHRAIKGVLHYKNIIDGIELVHLADAPGKSGLGSSSSFIVGMLNCINQLLHNEPASKINLATECIHIEQNILKETSGIQDAIWAAFSGIKSIEIDKDGTFKVKPLPVCEEFINKFHNSLVLFYTGSPRDSFEVAKSHDNKEAEQYKICIHQIAKEALSAFYQEDIEQVGKLLDESWQQKRQTSSLISTPHIDDIYTQVKRHGGHAKILGSGGGGYMLCLTPDKRRLLKNIDLINVDFSFDYEGSKIVLP
jgi:D-glycero-alpha-D-manno-heptose-7-phosphate kinase